jgi:hypothetical protein
MSITTYTELQAAIAAWMDRTDLTGVIPDFIMLFETTANTEIPLRTRYNLASQTLTTLAGTPTVSLPSDFLEAKSVVNQTDPKDVLDPYTAAALYTQFPQAATGRPKGFTYVGSTLELAPTPDAVYSLKLYYYQKVTALSASNPTNWLLTNFPNLYLFGSLLAAEAYLGTDPRLKLWGELYDNLINKVAGVTERGQYGGAALSVKVDAVV